jgi:hypothetical protein
MVLFSSKVGLYCGAVEEINQPLLPIGIKTPIFIAHLNFVNLNNGLTVPLGLQLALCENVLTRKVLQRECQFLNRLIFQLVKIISANLME